MGVSVPLAGPCLSPRLDPSISISCLGVFSPGGLGGPEGVRTHGTCWTAVMVSADVLGAGTSFCTDSTCPKHHQLYSSSEGNWFCSKTYMMMYKTATYCRVHQHLLRTRSMAMQKYVRQSINPSYGQPEVLLFQNQMNVWLQTTI